MTQPESQTTTTNATVVDAEIEFAAYGLWFHHRDVRAALFGVSRQHFDPTVRSAALAAWRATGTNPGAVLCWAARFTSRAATEQAAIRHRSA